MRHFFTLSVAPGSHRMAEAAAPARLITAASGMQRVSPRRSRTPFAAVNLAAIAVAADQHLRPTATAQKKPRGRCRAAGHVNPASTRSSPPTIIPPHSCPRTVQGTAPMQRAGWGRRRADLQIGWFLSHRPSGARRRRRASPSRVAQVGKQATPHARRSVAREALRSARGSPLFATRTTLRPSHAFRRNQAGSGRRRQA